MTSAPVSATAPRVREVAPGDLLPVLRLVRSVGLPAEGVTESFGGFVVAEAGGRIVGAAGLERHGRYRLLRSVAVAPALRRTGAGGALVQTLLRTADREQAAGVYLLTTSAEGYFSRFGFEAVERHRVAAEIRESDEFRSVCPASAVVMLRRAPVPHASPDKVAQ